MNICSYKPVVSVTGGGAMISRPSRWIASCTSLAAFTIATSGAHAQRAPTQSAVQVNTLTPEEAVRFYGLHPDMLPRPRPKVRCEQDRLLTGTTPCGEVTAEPLVLQETDEATTMIVPKRLKRCEMDRKITDTTPCERR